MLDSLPARSFTFGRRPHGVRAQVRIGRAPLFGIGRYLLAAANVTHL
jgi:hypothetical protein